MARPSIPSSVSAPLQRTTTFVNKQKPEAAPPSDPVHSYQDQAKTTQAYQHERLGKAKEKATARRLFDQAAQIFTPKANKSPAGFQTKSELWEVDAVKEVSASYIQELNNRDKKKFDSVALAKAIALIEHERDFIRDSKSSASASRENIFPDVKDKKAALEEAITELFKAVNQADKDETLDSFKHVGSGDLNKHHTMAAKAATKAVGVLSQFVGGEPTTDAILDGIKMLGKSGTMYVAYLEKKDKHYFKGAEELAPTVAPQMTPGTEDTKTLLEASLATENLADANEVKTTLTKAIEDGKDVLAKANKGSSKKSPQLMQKEITEKNKAIKTLNAAIQDGERVIQAEQDYKNASRNNKITGPGTRKQIVNYSQKGVRLASMIANLCGAGPAAPAAAFAINNLILLAYHFGGGAIADGEEKLMNILKSALKSDDLIDTNQISRRQIADLYGEYKKAVEKFGEGSSEELEARQTLQKNWMEK